MLAFANVIKDMDGKVNHPILTAETVESNLAFVGYDPTLAGDDYARVIEAFVSASSKAKVRGVLLIGNAGNGKTMVAHAMCNGLWIDAWNPDHQERFTTAYMTDLSTGGWVVDDLGREQPRNNFGIVSEPFGQLVNHQYARGYVTGDWRFPPVITTNMTLNEIKERYSSNILDRIYESFVIVPMNAASRRKANKEIIK